MDGRLCTVPWRETGFKLDESTLAKLLDKGLLKWALREVMIRSGLRIVHHRAHRYCNDKRVSTNSRARARRSAGASPRQCRRPRHLGSDQDHPPTLSPVTPSLLPS